MALAPRRTLLAASLLAASLGSSDRLSAQAVFPPRDLRAFQTEVAAIEDPARLRDLEHRYHESLSDSAAEADRHLRRGLVRIRLGELGDGWSFRRATGDFDEAAELEPGTGSTWAYRGVAYQAEGDWLAGDRLNIGKRVGFGSYEEALRSFARALELDPSDPVAAHGLYQVAQILGDTTRKKEVVLPALRRAASEDAPDTTLLFELGRLERLMGDSLASVRLFRRYLAAGGNPGLGLHELAWSLFVAGEPGGDSAYYAGAAADDSSSAAAYREDLALIADDSTLAAFDRASGPGRAAALHRFWSDHAAQALRSEPERLREHYRRITTAERRYGLEVNRRHYGLGGNGGWTDIYHSNSTRFDDRGIIYIRYGEPDAKVETHAFGVSPNQTWRYRRADGDFLLDFAANPGGDIRDYRLIPSALEIGGDTNEDSRDVIIGDRCPLYPPFCKVQSWGRYGAARVLREESDLARVSAALAVSSDGDEPKFAHALEAAAAAFAVGTAGEQQLIHVAYQVALEAPTRLPERVAFRLPLRVRLSLLDSAGHVGAYVDTTSLILLPGDEAARGAVDAVGRVTVPAPAGRWRYRISLETRDSTGIVLPTDSIDVRRFTGGGLAVSDLVLSKEQRGARWVPAEGDTAYFNPRRTWRRTDTIALYYEIYGLRTGSSYSARLSLRRGKRIVLTTGWEGDAEGATTRVTRSLSFETVQPGQYELIVEVAREDGAQARTTQSISIVE